MDDKFINFNGSLDNEPIEIPDKNSNSKDSSRKKVEDILNQIKSSEKDGISESFFEEMEKQLGDQFNQSSLFSLLNKMFGSGFMNSYSNEDDEEYEDEYEDDDIVETRKFIVPKEIRYINRELLFNIPCQRLGNKDLICFTDVANFNRIADVDPSIKEAGLDVNEITIETVGEYAVILKLSQRNISFDNIFAFGIFDKDGNPKVYVPLFGNAVGVDEEDENDVMFIDTTKFSKVSNQKDFLSEFIFGVNLCLAPMKRTILTPAQFGKIDVIRSACTADSNMLQIGTITSNESHEAMLLKKDADLDGNETVFKFYIKFNMNLSKNTLNKILSLISELNKKGLENLEFFKTRELKFERDYLYVELNVDTL